MNAIAIPDFVISDKDLQAIKEQLIESDTFEKEIQHESGWCLDVSGSARVQNFYEKETNSNWSDIDKLEIKIVLWDSEPNQFDFSDEFEKDIFDQINSISK